MFDKLRNPKVAIPTATLGSVVVLAGGTWLVFDSWLLAMVIALVVVLVALVVVLLRTIFQQEREEQLARGIEDRDQYARMQRDQLQQLSLESLEERFRRALDEIRGSRLGTEGLYELPWLLVIGEAGAGKSEALRQSGLELPAEYVYLLRGGATQDCDWWLTNQAIALDTAGAFLEESDEASRQWRRLLGLLRRSRPKVPIDGVLVAVPAPALLSRSGEELRQQAHTLRRRINELTDTLKVDAPIYVLVTKSDQIDGFSETVNALARERTREAFGWTNDRRNFADAGEEVLRGFEPVAQRLELLLPEMVMRESDPQRRRRLFTFPDDFGETVRAVADFLRTAFAPSIYDEVPFLRGVYFTSAKREGTSLSPVLRRLGQEWARSALTPDPAPTGGLFLSDVFREIIVGDRDLALPVRRLGRRTRRALVAAVASVSLAALVLLGIGFVDNLGAVRRLASDADAVVAGASSLASIERLREAIADRERQPFPLGGLGLNGPTHRALGRAQTTFNWAFAREFEEPTKLRLIGVLKSYGDDAFEALAELGLDISFLGTRAESPPPELLPYAPVGRDEADRQAFSAGYVAFVRWAPSEQLTSRIDQEREAQMVAAPRLLDIRVLEEWSEKNAAKHPPITYAGLGIPLAPDGPSTHVTGAYTRATWEALVRDLIESVENSGGASADQVAGFREEYVKRYDRKWRDFLVDTPLEPRADPNLSDSPYIRLVRTLAENAQADLPRSHGLPYYVQAVQEVLRDTPSAEEAEAKQRPPWTAYESTVEQLEADVAAALDQPEQALDQAVKLAKADTSHFHGALAGVRELVPMRPDVQAGAKLQEILSMPFLNGASALLDRALDELEKRWRDRIAVPFEGNLDTQRLVALYQPGVGELARFEQDELGGFYADGRPLALIGDRAMPFGENFLAWMRGAHDMRRTLYPAPGATPDIALRLEGVPSRVVGASGYFVTRRELTCEGGETCTYREGPGSCRFTWTPDCQPFSLRVFARTAGGTERELKPRLERTGPLALPQLLRSAKHLPGDRLQWRVQYEDPPLEVVVEYRLRAGREILNIAHHPPPRSMRE